MLKYVPYYFQCPNCHAWLEGRDLLHEMANETLLYSDGKELNDNFIKIPQKLILCPSCGHVFWIDDIADFLKKVEEKENLDSFNAEETTDEQPIAKEGQKELPFTKTKPDAYVYSWNTWRFFGVSFSDNKGKMALINHYKTFLQKRHFEPSKEIYLRRFLWWAYNDLHRNHQHVRLKYFLNGFMSFGVWHCNRMMILEGTKLFFKNQKDFNENLEQLKELLTAYPEEAKDLEMAEIYRELRQFDNAKQELEQKGSLTHSISEMLRHTRRKDPRVFMISG